MHLTLGILRKSQAVSHASAFFQLDGFAVPAPAQVTQTVSPSRPKFESEREGIIRMTLSSIFSAQLPLGRIALLAWLTATFLNLKWGIEIAIRDVQPVEFVLQAGFLFGYYIALMFFIRLALLIPVAILSNSIAVKFFAREAKRGFEFRREGKASEIPENSRWMYEETKEEKVESEKKSGQLYNSLAIQQLRSSKGWKKFEKRLLNIVANFADVIAMLTAFFIYTEKNLETLAPIGIIIALVLFVFGGFDEPISSNDTDNQAAG
ncbi:MAG: hypothetical protein KAY64_00280 [Anaerolineales bacterium]|nr:hypothetical protein [Anaerolineales bacterium]